MEREAVEAGCRVSVCLRRVFSDERAQCWVWAARARPVRWLAARLGACFGLDARCMRLMCRGHLLPPDEPLAMLQHDDRLEVVMKDHIVEAHVPSEENSIIDKLHIQTVPSQKETESNNIPNGEITKIESTLIENKQRALALLASLEKQQNSTFSEPDVDCTDYCATPHYESSEDSRLHRAAPTHGEPTAKKRRRVRRRRPAPYTDPCTAPCTAPSPAPSPAPRPAGEPPPPQTPPPRLARVVRALSPVTHTCG